MRLQPILEQLQGPLYYWRHCSIDSALTLRFGVNGPNLNVPYFCCRVPFTVSFSFQCTRQNIARVLLPLYVLKGCQLFVPNKIAHYLFF